MRWLLLWEAFLTFFTIVAASIGFTDLLPAKDSAWMVIIAQGLNSATIVYKTGQWNPNPGAAPPAPVVVVQGHNAEPPHTA